MFCEKGLGNPKIEQRKVNEFDKIDINGKANVILEQGNEYKVVVEIDSNLLEFVKTEVSGTTLEIYDDKCLEEITTYNIRITTSKLKKLYIYDAVNIKSESIIKSDDLYIKSKGTGEISLGIETEDLEIVTSGSATIKLFGSTVNFEIDADDKSTVDAFGLLAKKVDADVDGKANCKINVSDKFYAKVDDTGSILYIGNPKKVKTKVSGSGSIKAK